MNNDEKNMERPSVPLSHRVYGDIIHWLTILSCVMALFAPIVILMRGGNNLVNPYSLFSSIFNSASPAEIWANTQGGVFPGAHYYFGHWGWGDSWGMLAVTLGCSVGLWAVVPAAILQLSKERDRLYGILGLVFGLLILLSMVGVLRLQTG